MKLIMTLLVKDEQDIIRENIEFHKSQGVDFFIVTDNRSTDDTSKILKKYESQGILKYIYEEKYRDQSPWVTQMARMAYIIYDADWIINNDADEFWWPQQGNLKETFQKIPAQYNLLRAQRHNFIPVHEYTPPFFRHMVYREKISLNPIGKPLPAKVAHRGFEQIKVAPGNHMVDGIKNPRIFDGSIEIFHFPIRDYEQLVRKTVSIGEAYERNKTQSDSIGIARRTVYKEYRRNGNTLQNYYSQKIYDKNRINKEIESGSIVEDSQLLEYFYSIF
ncbi:glycosyltransferase family 92 protein [Spirochaetota bacterium]